MKKNGNYAGWHLLLFVVNDREDTVLQVLLLANDVPHLWRHREGTNEPIPEQDAALRMLSFIGITRLSSLAASDNLPEWTEEKPILWRIDWDEAEFLASAAHAKACTYERVETPDAYCLAGAPSNSTDPVNQVRATIGARHLVATTASTCRGCEVPDDRVRCSALHHIQVGIRVGAADMRNRTPKSAMCDLGRLPPDGRGADTCRPAGRDCWHRVVSSSRDYTAAVGPLALHEELDHLALTWRVAYGKGADLLPVAKLTTSASLGQPCETQDELRSRVIDLAEVINGFSIVGGDVPKVDTEGSLNQLLRALQVSEKLDEVDQERAKRSVDGLRRLTWLRNVYGHVKIAADREQQARAYFNTPIGAPPAEAWQRIRARVVADLRLLRSAMRALI